MSPCKHMDKNDTIRSQKECAIKAGCVLHEGKEYDTEEEQCKICAFQMSSVEEWDHDQHININCKASPGKTGVMVEGCWAGTGAEQCP